MAVAWVLTLVAFAGIAAGLFLRVSGRLSDHFAAAGGGMLFGLALFRVIPEIAESSGWWPAIALSTAACCLLIGLDRWLIHMGHSPRHGVIAPLLAAAAVHSFLDGWSVRALALQPVSDVAAPLGLALHKIPEGFALGWVVRRSMTTRIGAAATAASVEAMTLLGAFVEPRANQSGVAAFGAWWSAVVLATIAGAFLFLGAHALLPARKRRAVLLLFFTALVIVAGITLLGPH